jgi:hypothetical protein
LDQRANISVRNPKALPPRAAGFGVFVALL